MKNKLIRILLVALLSLPGMWACQDEVELPRQTLGVGTHLLIAPSFATDLSLGIESNSAWTITIEGDADYLNWLLPSADKGTGAATVTFALEKNATAANRSVEIVVRCGRTLIERVTLTQATTSAEGYISPVDLRALLGSESTLAIDKELRMRGIVVSSVEDNSYFENCIALEGSDDAGYGFTIRTAEPCYYNVGEELEIQLQGATVAAAAESGVMTISPRSDADIQRTSTSQIAVAARKIDYEALCSGAYESMYVAIQAQVVDEDLARLMGDNVTVRTANFDRFTMVANQKSTFGGEAVPQGSGLLKGIVVKYNGAYAVMPCTASDFALTDKLMGAAGINLPYVFSLMTNNTSKKDNVAKYVTVNAGTYAEGGSDFSVTDKDLKLGVVMTASIKAPKESSFALKFETGDHCFHRIAAKSWGTSREEGRKYYVQLELPLNEDLPAVFQLKLGLTGTGGVFDEWVVSYSNDGINFTTPADGSTRCKFSGAAAKAGNNFHFFTLRVAPTIAFDKGSTLYLRISPDSDTNNNGATPTDNADLRIHSAIVIEAVPAYATPKPAGALYFEPFDMLTEGADYLAFGDRLAGMIHYCGSDISQWAVTNGLQGSDVRQRPGYAQIGWVNTLTVAAGSWKNSVGSLTTPALSALTQKQTVTLGFKAAAFRDKAAMIAAGSYLPADRNGDITSIVVNVLGGGTIDGADSKTITGLSDSDWTNVSLTITDATPQTQLQFTSAPSAGEFSRWFIDEIVVLP